MPDIWPVPFRIGQYDFIEIHDLKLSGVNAAKIASHARIMLIDALRVDGRKDPRWHDDEQDEAEFVCGGPSEYIRLRLGAWRRWQKSHSGDTWQEFCRWFDTQVDDTIINPNLPNWLLIMYDRQRPRVIGVADTTFEYYGAFLAYNIKTIRETEEQWTASMYGILCAPTSTKRFRDTWIDNFGMILRYFLVDKVALNDGRIFALDSWEFTTDRPWLTYDPTVSPYLTRIFDIVKIDVPRPVVEEKVPGTNILKRMRLERRIALHGDA
jgi:hypothetical protein